MRNKFILFFTFIVWVIFIFSLTTSTLETIYQGYVCMGGTMVIFGIATLVTKFLAPLKDR